MIQDDTITNEQPESGISLTDLNLLVQIVDLASSRGAFRGAELTQVGAVYDKVSGFLKYVAAQQEQVQSENSNEPVGPEGV